ncbi:hypothetical protein PV04_09873 [Phialophora macrospora]|uniref:FAD-binding domain-containing protein n=1 Tax=Phialophora macrospora TaxID=1851006 RepID=A0A0D2F7R7_9EURO|nr:hypothetical protein PV04_09873 [Phialophora macrospora]
MIADTTDIAFAGPDGHPRCRVVDTDALVVGTGPAGASLACFLGSQGIQGIMVGIASTTADTPRAHITNMAAMVVIECLRDIDLERDCNQVASHNETMQHVRWSYSFAGEEFGRMYSWGNDPEQKGDYEKASPCGPVDLPQTRLEPILVRYATLHGFKCRFDTEFVSSTEDKETGRILVSLKDRLNGVDFQIRCRYLFGADGARSRIATQIELPLAQKPDKGIAYNVLVRVDMAHLMDARMGNLHWIMQPDKEHPDWAWICVVRMVKPWDEWMFVVFPDRKAAWEDHKPTNEQWLARIKEFIGDGSIPAEIIGVSKWRINDTVADQYSKGNVFCLGDAVHRHPPMNGLGSNTCIQDAFNLAWKVAYVLKGLAGPELLESYSVERQPVGKGVVARANQGFNDYGPLWENLGILEDDVEKRRQIWHEFSENSSQGRQRRQTFQRTLHATKSEIQGLGIEMNQRYTAPQAAVHRDDEESTSPPAFVRDPIRYYEPSTYPGCRVPHVWLTTLVPGKKISTIDLSGKGRFTLFTGIGGREAWRSAAERVKQELKTPIKVFTIGYRQDYEDIYMDWARLREVDEDGVVLVRPDRFVAWRSQSIPEDCEGKLVKVLRHMLHL